LTNPLLQSFHKLIAKTFSDCDTNTDTDEVPIKTKTDTDCNTDIRFSHFFNKIQAEKLQVSHLSLLTNLKGILVSKLPFGLLFIPKLNNIDRMEFSQ
jgi:hypothetical protein